MFFYVVCALLLLNAFTEAQPSVVPCADQGGESFCLGPYHAGQCSSPDFQPIAQMYCAKTCGICH
ncbi:shTK domain protein [Ostertagia ostertagi]